MSSFETNHYATLGLDPSCTGDQIRTAYRLLAKQFHPDLNAGSAEARERTQALNAAYEVLGDAEERRIYDRKLQAEQRARRKSGGSAHHNLDQELSVRIKDLLRGATMEVQVNDPGNPDGPETYELKIPAGTAPNARLRVDRDQNPAGGLLRVKLKVQPGHQFKVRGSDLRCDLKISVERATKGGSEVVRSATGGTLRIEVPPGVPRGEVLRIEGEGLPKTHGGRGDLLVKISYQPQVRFKRASGW